MIEMRRRAGHRRAEEPAAGPCARPSPPRPASASRPAIAFAPSSAAGMPAPPLPRPDRRSPWKPGQTDSPFTPAPRHQDPNTIRTSPPGSTVDRGGAVRAEMTPVDGDHQFSGGRLSTCRPTKGKMTRASVRGVERQILWRRRRLCTIRRSSRRPWSWNDAGLRPGFGSTAPSR
jgi:hypothetical protein